MGFSLNKQINNMSPGDKSPSDFMTELKEQNTGKKKIDLMLMMKFKMEE